MRHPRIKFRPGLFVTAAGLFSLLAPAGTCTLIVACRTATAGSLENEGPPLIADPSEWDFTRTNGMGVKQKGYIKIDGGRLYAWRSDRAVGRVFLDDNGQVHLEFLGHPKIAQGEAVIKKDKPGQWSGFLVFADDEWEFVMKRK